jgi:hypothetical protein
MRDGWQRDYVIKPYRVVVYTDAYFGGHRFIHTSVCLTDKSAIRLFRPQLRELSGIGVKNVMCVCVCVCVCGECGLRVSLHQQNWRIFHSLTPRPRDFFHTVLTSMTKLLQSRILFHEINLMFHKLKTRLKALNIEIQCLDHVSR